MAVQNIKSSVPQEPAFITYLLSQDIDHDCYFIVGNETLVLPERIGVVKKMLLAHSEVLRAELQDSKMAEKEDVVVVDIYPDTFKSLLKFVYGYDNISTLSFDEADNLLYTAEKYMIQSLKDKLAVHLMSLLTTNNICTLLNNPACFKNMDLNSAITEILQYETDKVLANHLFLDLSREAFAKILEQDTLNVSEIEVWRAALKWAKYNADSEEGLVLRKQLSNLTQYIRVCTLTPEDFCSEVVPTNVISYEEVKLICLCFGKREKQTSLINFSNIIEARKKQTRELVLDFNKCQQTKLNQATLYILTNECGIELLPLEFSAKSHSWNTVLERTTYQCVCTVKVMQITNFESKIPTETLVTVTFCEQIEYGKNFVVPLISNGEKLILQPNKMFALTVKFSHDHTLYCERKNEPYCNKHLKIEFGYRNGDHSSWYTSPIKRLLYKIIK